MTHPPLFYATYLGPQPVAYVGDSFQRRSYAAGQTTQIGQEDADAIAAQDQFEFSVEAVPLEIIGTAEEAQPEDASTAIERNTMLAALDGQAG